MGHQKKDERIDLGSNTFETFCQYIFHHNEDLNENVKWKVSLTPSVDGLLKHYIRLFREAGSVVKSLSPQTIYEGFKYISGPQGEFSLPADLSGDLNLRREFYLSMEVLFRDVMSRSELHSVSFLWFENIMVWCQDSNRRNVFDDREMLVALLETERLILMHPMPASQKAALHGLNHLHHELPQETERVIDEFLNSGRAANEEIRQYAVTCRSGSAL